ncbi:hypothetical protein [Microbacterium sp. 1P10AE]|uniref:hypothetical protein n=1 Tax=Microbacterium sp. 1P10AE TaxID=3132286 RepID=UPI0039A24B88
MPTQEVKTTIALPVHLVDLAKVALDAKKTIVPGATDLNGAQNISIVAKPPTFDTTEVVTRVVT